MDNDELVSASIDLMRHCYDHPEDIDRAIAMLSDSTGYAETEKEREFLFNLIESLSLIKKRKAD